VENRETSPQRLYATTGVYTHDPFAGEIGMLGQLSPKASFQRCLICRFDRAKSELNLQIQKGPTTSRCGAGGPLGSNFNVVREMSIGEEHYGGSIIPPPFIHFDDFERYSTLQRYGGDGGDASYRL